MTQLSVFVLVARLGSVKAAAGVLHVSEPAISQALAALRRHFGDALIERAEKGMVLTPGGERLLSIASQMVALGGEAESAVRAAQGAPQRLRLAATSVVSEYVAAPILDAFTGRLARPVETSVSLATNDQCPALLSGGLADLAITSRPAADPGLSSEPIFRCRVVAVAGPQGCPRGGLAGVPWLVDPSGTEPDSEAGRLLRHLGIPESQVRVFPNQTAAWTAAAEGAGVAPAVAHLVGPRIHRGELAIVTTRATPMQGTWYVTVPAAGHRCDLALSLRRFLRTPEALHILRTPGMGVPAARFRPPVRVTIWS